MKILIAGWFSFSNGHATAGDLLSRDLAREWLESAGYPCDIAVAPPFTDGVDWRAVDPQSYSHVLFVCGPFEQGELEAEFLTHFQQCRLIGLNLSMRVPLHLWNPFDLLIERDSSARVHPEMVWGTHAPKVPVVGLCLVEEYEGGLTENANRAIHRLTRQREMAVVPIDTRLDVNSTGLRTPAEIESLIARVDMLITTRLHGAVLALKNGVPVLAIDPEAGGAKIRRQMESIGWPISFTADDLSDEQLRLAMEWCLTDEARQQARRCHKVAARGVERIGELLLSKLREASELEANYKARMTTLKNQGADPLLGNARIAGITVQDSLIRRFLSWVAKSVGASTRVQGERAG